MLTSQDDSEEIRRALALGVEYCLSKPARVNELYSCMVAAISGVPMHYRDAAGMHRQTLPPEPDSGIVAQVLLAEDNLVNQEIALAMLEESAYQVTVVENGRQALLTYTDGAFDLILMDCHMPEMDGFEATRRIRQQEKDSGRARTPIIALTANAISGDRERCLEAGMDDYIAKPFARAALLRTMAHWINPAPVSTAASASQNDIAAPSAPQQTEEVASLDPKALQALRALQRPGRPDVLTRIIDMFNNDAPRLLGEMHAAAGAGDAEALRRAAHTLKSTSANVGATILAATCKEIEQLARAADMTDATAHLNGVNDELDRVLIRLAQERVTGEAGEALAADDGGAMENRSSNDAFLRG